MFQIGLDNGVIVRGVTRKELPKLMRYPDTKDYIKNTVEICYWRKCNGLRQNFLSWAYNYYCAKEEVFEYRMNRKEIDMMIHILINYLRYPEEWDNNYWDFKNYKKIIRDQIWNLYLLKFWLRRHPDKEVYFYDSY